MDWSLARVSPGGVRLSTTSRTLSEALVTIVNLSRAHFRARPDAMPGAERRLAARVERAHEDDRREHERRGEQSPPQPLQQPPHRASFESRSTEGTDRKGMSWIWIRVKIIRDRRRSFCRWNRESSAASSRHHFRNTLGPRKRSNRRPVKMGESIPSELSQSFRGL